MIAKPAQQAIGLQLLDAFRQAGAQDLLPDILQPADSLLDLYGEDIRARAYVTTDPVRGEVMLRPDFTVPVVQMHMAGGTEPARYCYMGEVFRKHDHSDTLPYTPRDNEYLQAGFELFSRDPAADSELFALFYRLLAPYRLMPVMGDMGLLLGAVRALPVSTMRRDALSHHLWRPNRFARLLARLARPSRLRDFPATEAPWTGLRAPTDMAARIERVQQDASQPPLSSDWTDWFDRLLTIDAPAPEALHILRDLAGTAPAIAADVDRLAARLYAIAGQGIDPSRIRFVTSHGRQTMEYYDGMTFTFSSPDHPDWPPVASGGRYDALTAVLGSGRAIPAAGGIIHPGLLVQLENAQ